MMTRKSYDISETDLVLAYLEEKAVKCGGEKAIAEPDSFIHYEDRQPGFTVRIATGDPDVLANYAQQIRDVLAGSTGFRESGVGFQRGSVSYSLAVATSSALENIEKNDPQTIEAANAHWKRKKALVNPSP